MAYHNALPSPTLCASFNCAAIANRRMCIVEKKLTEILFVQRVISLLFWDKEICFFTWENCKLGSCWQTRGWGCTLVCVGTEVGYPGQLRSAAGQRVPATGWCLCPGAGPKEGSRWVGAHRGWSWLTLGNELRAACRANLGLGFKNWFLRIQ